VHIEEARLRFDMAIGKMKPVTEDEILLHLREFASEVRACKATDLKCCEVGHFCHGES